MSGERQKAVLPGAAGRLSGMSLEQMFEQQVQLAAIYAEDGAVHTAARLLREVADELECRGRYADAFIADLQKGHAP